MTDNEKSKLDSLVEMGCISKYYLVELDINGFPNPKDGKSSSNRGRNTEQLKLLFPNGEVLQLDTFCSGCSENTCLCIS